MHKDIIKLKKMKKIWTILDIIRWGTDYFAKAEIESPRLNIELIICETLQLRRLDLYTKFDRPFSEAELASLKQMAVRRHDREPLQYLLGKQSFIDIELLLDKRALVPRPETELLAEKAGKIVSTIVSKNDAAANVIDLGTGTGAIALYVAKHSPLSQVTAIDISQDAIDLARSNADMNEITNVSFFCSDILIVTPKKKYNLIVSNPPYISAVDYVDLEKELMFEPKIALTDEADGLTFYRRYAEIFSDMLSAEGEFLLEIGFGQAEEIIEMFADEIFHLEYIKDYAGIERILHGKLKII